MFIGTSFLILIQETITRSVRHVPTCPYLGCSAAGTDSRPVQFVFMEKQQLAGDYRMKLWYNSKLLLITSEIQ